MRIVLVCSLAILNLGAFLLLAPDAGNRAFEAMGLDPAYREAGGWILFTGAQFILAVFFSSLVTFWHADRQHYQLLWRRYNDAVGERDDLRQQAPLFGQEPEQLAKRITRLRAMLRKKRQQCVKLRHAFCKQNVEIAELRQLQLHLENADYDDERYVVLLRETAQLRERLQVAVSREEYERLLTQYHELRGRCAALQERAEKPALNGIQTVPTVTTETQRAAAEHST